MPVPRHKIEDASHTIVKRAISRLIRETVEDIPLKLIDTCLGVIVDRNTMISNFEKLDEYRAIEASLFSGKPEGACKRLQDLIKSHFEYAMFSHRWNETDTTKEPTYALIKGAQDQGLNIYDWKEQCSDGKDREVNMVKLRSFCYTAAKCGFRWAWSDTCCIDKTIPSEVQVSINSMFKWYHNSALTIVYFSDVEDVHPESRLKPLTSNSVLDFVAKHHAGSQNTPILRYAKEKHAEMFVDTQVDESALEDLLKRYFQQPNVPAWCVRCWTLQEMVAPQRLRFYCETWKALEPAFDPPDGSHIERFSNHREEPLWQNALSRSTGVDVKNLLHFTPGMTNVREKLHWASSREATCIEDTAYSLLGIFDIHMPVLYGEGMKAFVRLQEEIMKRSHDLSIFDFSSHASSVNSCLAHSPLCYKEKPFEWRKRENQMEIDAGSEEEGSEQGEDSEEEENSEQGGGQGSDEGKAPIWKRNPLIQLFYGSTSALLASAPALLACFKKFIESDLPLGHSLVNGTITISVFEHKAKIQATDDPLRYKATANGLTQAEFTTFEPLVLKHDHYLVRVYDRRVRLAIQIIADRIKFFFGDLVSDVSTSLVDGAKGLMDGAKGLVDDAKELEGGVKESADGANELVDGAKIGKDQSFKVKAKLDALEEEERKHATDFLADFFVVFLVAKDGDAWCRVATESRIIVSYRKYMFDQAVQRRTLV